MPEICPLVDIEEVRVVQDHVVWLRFADGTAGELDLGAIIREFRGVFAPCVDPAFFGQVRVDPEVGTLVWPNGADLDPDVLYGRLKGLTADDITTNLLRQVASP